MVGGVLRAAVSSLRLSAAADEGQKWPGSRAALIDGGVLFD
jgi:hypothetical protein